MNPAMTPSGLMCSQQSPAPAPRGTSGAGISTIWPTYSPAWRLYSKRSRAGRSSNLGLQCVHAIANGFVDEDGDDTRTANKMSAEAAGRTYLWLSS
jgi:hypothetical protein